MCRRLNWPRSNRVHNNKNIGPTQPKRLASLCCAPQRSISDTNPTISPVTHRAQLFHHMTTHVHHGRLLQAQSAILLSQGFSWPYGDIDGLPCQRVIWRCLSHVFPTLGSDTKSWRAQQNTAREFIPMCRLLNWPRSNRVHNNKNMGLTQPKRLASLCCAPSLSISDVGLI
jgi:hypothetical protein